MNPINRWNGILDDEMMQMDNPRACASAVSSFFLLLRHSINQASNSARSTTDSQTHVHPSESLPGHRSSFARCRPSRLNRSITRFADPELPE